MFEFLKNFRKPTVCELPETPKINTEKIDESLRLLHETTMEVSKTAIDAVKHLQEKLKYTERRFFSTIDSVEDVIIVKDSNNKWKTLNLAGQRIFGFHHNEYYGKTDKELMELFPRFKKCIRFDEDTDEFTWELQEPYRYDEIIPDEVGDGCQYFDVVKTPTYFPDGSRKELIVIGRNVTDARNHIKRQRACFLALNSVSDAIAILDKDGNVFFANDVFLKIFCNNIKMNEIEGKTLQAIIPDFYEYNEMWLTISKNHAWENQIDENGYRVAAVPMMNGNTYPIFYILTFKEAPQLTQDIRQGQAKTYSLPIKTPKYIY